MIGFGCQTATASFSLSETNPLESERGQNLR